MQQTSFSKSAKKIINLLKIFDGQDDRQAFARYLPQIKMLVEQIDALSVICRSEYSYWQKIVTNRRVYPENDIIDNIRYLEAVEREIKETAEVSLENGILKIVTIPFLEAKLDAALNMLGSQQRNKKNPLPWQTCYDKMYIIPVDNYGVEQLRLFRMYEDVMEKYVMITFEQEERRNTDSSLIDGQIDGTPVSVMFNLDITRLGSLIAICDPRYMKRLSVICFDFQQEFYKKAFEKYPHVGINPYPIDEVKKMLDMQTSGF